MLEHVIHVATSVPLVIMIIVVMTVLQVVLTAVQLNAHNAAQTISTKMRQMTVYYVITTALRALKTDAHNVKLVFMLIARQDFVEHVQLIVLIVLVQAHVAIAAVTITLLMESVPLMKIATKLMELHVLIALTLSGSTQPPVVLLAVQDAQTALVKLIALFVDLLSNLLIAMEIAQLKSGLLLSESLSWLDLSV